jgi:hypothetical protein
MSMEQQLASPRCIDPPTGVDEKLHQPRDVLI